MTSLVVAVFAFGLVIGITVPERWILLVPVGLFAAQAGLILVTNFTPGGIYGITVWAIFLLAPALLGEALGIWLRTARPRWRGHPSSRAAR